MNVIVIRQDELGFHVVVRIPDGSSGESVFASWAEDPSVSERLEEYDLSDVVWEELEVIELGQPFHDLRQVAARHARETMGTANH
jgi:hypothetical protein